MCLNNYFKYKKEEKLIKLLDKLAEKGITGKYNIIWADFSLPFLILNKEALKDFIIQSLNEITLKIVKEKLEKIKTINGIFHFFLKIPRNKIKDIPSGIVVELKSFSEFENP